jgi:hypothetical protein
MSGARIPVGQCYPWAFAATEALEAPKVIGGSPGSRA